MRYTHANRRGRWIIYYINPFEVNEPNGTLHSVRYLVCEADADGLTELLIDGAATGRSAPEP